MASEIWRKVPGFEETHEVSNLGRVRTIPRTYAGGKTRLDGRKATMSIREKVLRTRVNLRGYECVDLSGIDARLGTVVHRLVCRAFNGEAPTDKHEVNHIDGDKLNNRLENLEWVSPRQNSQHAYDAGLRAVLRGTQVGSSKLDDAKVREIRRMIAAGMSQRVIARHFGVSILPINRVAQGLAWKHVV